MKPSLKFLAAFVAVSFCFQATAATITVTSDADSGAGSLRQAIADAASGDTINFDSSLYGQTITLTGGQLAIAKNLTISGPGAYRLAVSGNNASRVFNIGSGEIVTISGLTITAGLSGVKEGGGGIFNSGTLSVIDSTISNNHVPDGQSVGGGIRNTGSLTVSGSTFTGNQSNGGGGIESDTGGTLNVSNSTVSGNTTFSAAAAFPVAATSMSATAPCPVILAMLVAAAFSLSAR